MQQQNHFSRGKENQGRLSWSVSFTSVTDIFALLWSYIWPSNTIPWKHLWIILWDFKWTDFSIFWWSWFGYLKSLQHHISPYISLEAFVVFIICYINLCNQWTRYLLNVGLIYNTHIHANSHNLLLNPLKQYYIWWCWWKYPTNTTLNS